MGKTDLSAFGLSDHPRRFSTEDHQSLDHGAPCSRCFPQATVVESSNCVFAPKLYGSQSFGCRLNDTDEMSYIRPADQGVPAAGRIESIIIRALSSFSHQFSHPIPYNDPDRPSAGLFLIRPISPPVHPPTCSSLGEVRLDDPPTCSRAN